MEAAEPHMEGAARQINFSLKKKLFVCGMVGNIHIFIFSCVL